jgi:hypothetical protein
MATVIVAFWTIRRIAGIATMPIAIIPDAVVANVYGAMAISGECRWQYLGEAIFR